MILRYGIIYFGLQNNLYNVGSNNNGRNIIDFQSYDERENTFTNGTGIYINEAEIVVANIRARSVRGDEQVNTCIILE